MKTFVMYGPETREHVELVRQLGKDLLAGGVDCEVDLLAKTPADGWKAWTEARIAAADVVLLVPSPAFAERIEAASNPAIKRAPRHDAKLVAGILSGDGKHGNERVIVALPDGLPDTLVPTGAAGRPVFRVPSQTRELVARLAPARTVASGSAPSVPSASAASTGSTSAPAPESAPPPSASGSWRTFPSSRAAASGGPDTSSRDPAALNLLRSYLATLLALYERNDGMAHFVRPSGESEAGAVPDVVAHVKSVLARDPSAMVLLLGEYGSGKTFFTRRLAYELARDTLLGVPDPIVPFYLSLSFAAAAKKTSVVRALSLFVGRYDVRLSEATLRELFRGIGRVVLILDGLDELGARIKRDETPRLVAALSELRAIPGLRVVLTCRSTFFRDSVDEDQIQATEKLTLKPFDDRQIAEYLAGAPENARRGVTAVFERVPRLRELCRTPIHLFLCEQYVGERALDAPSGASAASAPDGPAPAAPDFRLIDLYDAFVRKSLVLHAGSNPGWSPAARREFVRRLLYVMFDEGAFEMTMADLERLLAHEMPEATGAELAQMSAQIANFGFFTRAGKTFRPMHLSFLEYFVAETLVADLYAGRIDTWNRRPLYAEVFDFMVQMIERRGVEGLPVRAIAASEKEEAPSNFLATMYRWPVPAVRSFFEELLLDGRFPLVRCVACQGVGIYDSPEVVPTLLAAFDREPNGIIKAVVQRLLERLTEKVDPAARADIDGRLGQPVPISPGDAEDILSTRKNAFALTAYRKALLLGDRRPSSTIAALYLLAAAGDRESFPAMTAVAARCATTAIRTAYAQAEKLAPLPPLP
jgi:hypothetical protein